MNRFHWHLTDDQGWRIEIKKYPRLTQIGAWRDSTLVGHMARDTTTAVFDHKKHGGFYTQDDVREIVAYAADRFVEVMELFPGPFIHIGGDEAPKLQWKSSPRAQARIKTLGLYEDEPANSYKNEDKLQSWFTTQMDSFLTKRGRRLIGWDEILEGGLAPNAVVMSWRGIQGGLAAARADHDVVMTPGSYTYFDKYQGKPDSEPLAIGGFLPIDSVYAYEPVPSELEPQFRKHILGAQAQVWTEYIEGPKNVEYMAFPRVAALAEVLWTPAGEKNLADFESRLPVHLKRLNALDVNYRP
jgi:hexosaminidase